MDAKAMLRFIKKLGAYAEGGRGRKAQPELMAAHRFAWMDNTGVHRTGASLPPGWPNPYWKIHPSGEMSLVWGEDGSGGSVTARAEDRDAPPLTPGHAEER